MADNKLELVVEVDASRANASIKGVNSSLSSLEATAVKSAGGASQGIDGMTMSMTKGVLAGQALYGALMSLARAARSMTLGAIEMQDSLGKTAQRVGMGVESLSALRYAAQLSDVDMSDLAVSIARFSKNIAGGSVQLDALGIKTRNADHSMRDTYAILSDVAAKFAQMPDGVQKTALAVELFGRGGARLIPLLNQGSSGLASMAKEARELGIVMSDEDAKKAEEFEDNLKTLRSAVLGLELALSKELVPAALEFTDAAIKWVRGGGLQELVAYLKQAAEYLKILAIVVVEYKLISILYSLETAIGKVALATRGLNAVLLANPWTVAAAGVVALGTVVWAQKEKLDAYQQSLSKAADKAALFAAVNKGATLADLRKQGYTDEAIRSAYGMPAPPTEKQKATPYDEEDVRKAQEAARKIAEAEKRSAEILDKARRGEQDGLAKILEQYRQYRQELGLSAKAQRDLASAETITLRQEAAKEMASYAQATAKELEEANEYWRKIREQQLKDSTDFADETSKIEMESAQSRLNYEQTVAEQIRDAQLRQLDAVGARTVEQQVALQQKRLEIEIDYLNRTLELKREELNREKDLEIAEMEAVARARGISEELIQQRRAAIDQKYSEQTAELEAGTQEAIQAAKENTAIKQAQIVEDYNQKVFDTFKREAEGVFDALLTKGQSVWSALANSLKTAVLTAIKEILSSEVAALLMRLFTGLRVPVGLSGAGGAAAILGAAAPAFGSTGGFNVPIPGVPEYPGGLGGITKIGGILSKGALSASSLAPLGLGASLFGLTSAFRLGQKGGVGTALGAGLGAFSGLLGFGSLTAMFPALLAAGPFGWIAAGAVGAITGLIGLFHKSAEQKAREKIKATYGVDIREKNILTEIVNMAKQGFGGNLDAAIRSQQVRDLVELYAMSTGQSTSGIPPKVTPVSLLQQGGLLYQQNASNGAFSLDRIGAGAPSGGTTVINISIPGAKEFFEQETVRVVVNNPRTVQSAVMSAMKQNSGRRQSAALQMSPGLVMA